MRPIGGSGRARFEEGAADGESARFLDAVWGNRAAISCERREVCQVMGFVGAISSTSRKTKDCTPDSDQRAGLRLRGCREGCWTHDVLNDASVTQPEQGRTQLEPTLQIYTRPDRCSSLWGRR